jgi:diguanylate cyclase (GGDEF)-like protein
VRLAQPSAIPDRYRIEARSRQLDEAMALVNYLAVTHIVVALTVLVLFWNIGPAYYLFGQLVLTILIVVLAARGVKIYRAQPASAELVDRGHRAARLLALALGTVWGAMPVFLMAPSDADHRTLVVVLVAGLIVDAYVIGPILALSFLVTIPIVVGSFIGLVNLGEAIAGMLAILLTIYAGFVLVSVRRMADLSTQRILDQVRVAEQNETIGLLLNDFEANTSDWLWETDADGNLQHVSERMAQVSGQPLSALRHAPIEALFLSDRSVKPATDIAEVIGFVRDRIPFRDHVVEVAVAEAPRWWRLSGKPIYDKAETFLGFRGVGSDITASRQSEARIAYLASYDALTGLANRTLFHDLVTAECGRAADADRACALLYLDLDGFKLVNDTFGHGFGDALLRRVAARLRSTARDGRLVARLGGDEFAILCPCGEAAEASALGRAVIDAISAPYVIEGVQVEIGVSIGIAMAPADAAEPEGLLGKADLALYRAKAGGKGQLSIFEPGLEIAVRTRRDLETDLKLAIAAGELELHYQPLISLADGRVHSFEALLRWNRRQRGFVSPADFVPVAEAAGLIATIGRWVLLQACTEAARWPSDIRVAVNISPTQFRNSDLVDDVKAALAASGLDPARLEVEITESVFFEMNAVTIANLRELRALGIRIALDDFGTGYSSLSYLIRFPVDKIKIDRSFIKDMGQRHECLAVIETILALARKLSITVTAEGVETVEQALLLQRSRCDDIQGFLFSPARPSAEIDSLVETLPQTFRALLARDDSVALVKACA